MDLCDYGEVQGTQDSGRSQGGEREAELGQYIQSEPDDQLIAESLTQSHPSFFTLLHMP